MPSFHFTPKPHQTRHADLPSHQSHAAVSQLTNKVLISILLLLRDTPPPQQLGLLSLMTKPCMTGYSPSNLFPLEITCSRLTFPDRRWGTGRHWLSIVALVPNLLLRAQEVTKESLLSVPEIGTTGKMWGVGGAGPLKRTRNTGRR